MSDSILIAEYQRKLENFGYRISEEGVSRMVKKFWDDPTAVPIGGPETFIKGWLAKA